MELTELATVVSLLIVKTRGLCGKRICGGIGTNGTAVQADGISWASGTHTAIRSDVIEDGVGIQLIVAQFAEIFSGDTERNDRQENSQQHSYKASPEVSC